MIIKDIAQSLLHQNLEYQHWNIAGHKNYCRSYENRFPSG